MNNDTLRYLSLCACLAVATASCSKPTESSKAPAAEPNQPSGYKIYVTSEISGDLNVIDSSSMAVTSTVKLGKRPRGIHASPDGQFIYIALSGSPPAGPGVDESTLPPPDKSADAGEH